MIFCVSDFLCQPLGGYESLRGCPGSGSDLRLIEVPLTDDQYDTLVSFTFNLGAGALQRSTLRRKVNREEHAEVPAQLMRWVWAGGRILPGLKKRRAAEAKVYQI